jgi:APA family basic amino acid/polyamine antiporter
VLALFGALCVAELSCMYPRTGGVYVFLREAYGPLPAFLYGWTRMLLLVPASVGAIALIFATYLAVLVPVGPVGERGIAVAVIVMLTAVNYRSVKWGAGLENVLTVTKLVALAALAAGIFVMASAQGGAFAAPMRALPDTWSGFGLALVTVMWTYSGWSSIAAMAGEVRDPDRNMPRALLGGILVVIALYLLTNAAFLYVLPLDEMGGSALVAADAATHAFGARGGAIVATVVVIATVGALQAAIMFNPRIFYAMAGDGLLFPALGDTHRRFLTPHVATVFTAMLGIGYLMIRSFEQLAQAFILGVWPFHILMVLAVIRLRRTRPDAPRPYRTWGYPFVPGAFLLASAAMILNALFEQPGLTLFGFLLILAGVPVYFFVARRRAR